MYLVYILQSGNRHSYIGMTNDFFKNGNNIIKY